MLEPLRFNIDEHSFLMIPVEGGEFRMGSEENDTDAYDDEKIHRVSVSPFYLAQFPVTQSLWAAIMDTDASPAYFSGYSRPVEQVSWDDAQAFLQRLEKITKRRFRLPTEAEWEFAARGGIYNMGCKYAGSNRLKETAWFDRNSHDETKPAGRKFPNELGLYDMSGNVWEWYQDWYGSDYYKKSPEKDPKGPDSGSDRVVRGGSWPSAPRGCRSAYRRGWRPGGRDLDLGFRLALSLQAAGPSSRPGL